MSMVYSGEISDIDAKRGYVRVNIPDLGIVTEWIAYGREFTMGSSKSIPITINTQVLVCETFSKRWFVLCATPNDEDKPYDGASESKWGVKFADGTLIEYDIETKKLTVNAPMAEVDITSLTAKITAPEITLTGAVTVDGALVASSGVSVLGGDFSVKGNGSILLENGGISAGGDIKSGDISLVEHIHPGVQPGSGVTGQAE